MMKYDGSYRGIVIQNNDPKHEGRVKVYVPGVNIQQLENWNQKKEEDKAFKVLGKNTNSSITSDILAKQKRNLFWAEVMLPIVGNSAPGIYHAPSDTYYIGNDSDYPSQESNKSQEFFYRDTRTEEDRPTYYTFTGNSIPPRNQIALSFSFIGQKYCVNYKCDDNDYDTPFKNPPSDTCIDFLPVKFTYRPLESLSARPVADENINDSITSIELNIINPIITVDGQEIDKNSPLYRNICDPVTENPFASYNPPILFEADESPITNISFPNLPVTIVVNDRSPIGQDFKFKNQDTNNLYYDNSTTLVKIPKKNIKNVKIRGRNKKFDIFKILSLLPLLQNLFSSIIMPRAPMSQGQIMYSRGGGGGEIYNSVNSRLIPATQRRDSHIGGANNESKYTVNQGRAPLNDTNRTKGSNLRGKLQLHRGPMRAPDYNNDWKGAISIPGVGSKVWVMFENGDVNYPIIIGTFASGVDYQNIFEVQ